jgi:hypothetical protein
VSTSSSTSAVERMASQPKTCTNADCNFAADAKCLEGYEISECPHIGQLSIDDIAVADDTAAAEWAAETQPPELPLALSPGEALDRQDASKLQGRRISRSIGVIGPHDSGKTSLIAGIFDLLQEGPLSEISFAGSWSLVGFERICHLARAVSKRVEPHTPRTTVGADATFFHLDLNYGDSGIISLYIGDRSGEDYLGVNDEIALADQFFEIRRADCVTLLVNGAHLADSARRHEVKAMVPQIVDALVEAGAIRAESRLAVVLTKKDTVVASPQADRVTKDFEALVASLGNAHGTHFGEVKPFVVAASPKDCDKVARGEGLGDLLQFWLQPSMVRLVVPVAPSEQFERMIDNLSVTGEAID